MPTDNGAPHAGHGVPARVRHTVLGLCALAGVWAPGVTCAARREPVDGLALQASMTLGTLSPPSSATWGSESSPPSAQPPCDGVARTTDAGRAPTGPAWALDASTDLTARHGRSADLALTWAPAGGLSQSGLRLRVARNDSSYRYSTDPARSQFVHGSSQQHEVLMGYGWSGETASWVVLAGRTWARAWEDGGVLVELRGVKAAASVFARPAPSWRIFSTVSHTAATRYTQFFTKVGHVAPGGWFWGPEAKLDWRGGDPWQRAPASWRSGLHISSVAWAGAWWSVSAGRVQDHSVGSGAYLGLGAYASF